MLLLAGGTVSSQQPNLSFGNLTEGQIVSGFKTVAVYLDDSDHAMGARFRHERSGFTLDLLQIQSVPQAFIWVTTYPTSNMGEPHTQEHLLLGKGNAGRWLGNALHSSFAASSAFTAGRRTAYHFSTSAGPATFWSLLREHLSALLHPDYSDEEIRREVRNFDVAKQPDGTLLLDEKGTVYNEMVRTTEGGSERSYSPPEESRQRELGPAAPDDVVCGHAEQHDAHPSGAEPRGARGVGATNAHVDGPVPPSHSRQDRAAARGRDDGVVGVQESRPSAGRRKEVGLAVPEAASCGARRRTGARAQGPFFPRWS